MLVPHNTKLQPPATHHPPHTPVFHPPLNTSGTLHRSILAHNGWDPRSIEVFGSRQDVSIHPRAPTPGWGYPTHPAPRVTRLPLMLVRPRLPTRLRIYTGSSGALAQALATARATHAASHMQLPQHLVHIWWFLGRTWCIVRVVSFPSTPPRAHVRG